MMYDERFVTPMREELTRLGIEELRTAAAVDGTLGTEFADHVVAVGIAAATAALQDATLKSALGLLRQIFEIEG